MPPANLNFLDLHLSSLGFGIASWDVFGGRLDAHPTWKIDYIYARICEATGKSFGLLLFVEANFKGPFVLESRPS